ncbi:hypothetical protein [Maribellus mangrovi]|uniref:hypothetical protein n=1 Tax=Maribellus mangrovi TaxID=3133146 RepID=UPI0030EB4968
MSLNIVVQISLSNSGIRVQGKEVLTDSGSDQFLNSAYKSLRIKYPKFFKMDDLSKLGFIASELLLGTEEAKNLIDKTEKNKIGIVLQNSDSSVDVDRKHLKSIADKENYYPSPALFVYTLPNIVMGEISIRNNFKGENALFIFEKYNAEFNELYINSLFRQNKLEACIGGWFNANNGIYQAEFYLAAKE